LVGYAIGTNELVIRDWVDPNLPVSGIAHSDLTGLVDPADDHTQYLATDNRRSTSGLTISGTLAVDDINPYSENWVNIQAGLTVGDLTVQGVFTGAGSPSDHGTLGGLGDDDHPQYLGAGMLRPAAGLTITNTVWVDDIQPESAGFVTVSSGLTVTSDLTVNGEIFGEVELPRSYLTGLETANDAGDAAHDIEISVGECRDDTNVENMILATIITKRIDASWAVGDNQGGLDGTESVAGTPDADTTYHVFLIKRSDTGVVDALFSENATAPTLPSNYDYQRRIASVVTNGSANIINYIQDGERFDWNAPVQEYIVNTVGTSQVTRALTVPTGLSLIAVHKIAMIDTTPVVPEFTIVLPLDVADTAPTSALKQLDTSDASERAQTVIEIRTNTSGEIGTRTTTSDADIWLVGTTFGWIDKRGRDD
jgi:hypothetical protein